MSAARLPAAERRAALLEVACRAFAGGSYRGTTTAEIAREAGVTEPILYRHFESKRDLYLACLDLVSERVRTMWDEAIAQEDDPGLWLGAMGAAFFEETEEKAVLSNFWVRALMDASEDEDVRPALVVHMQKAHGYVKIGRAHV